MTAPLSAPKLVHPRAPLSASGVVVNAGDTVGAFGARRWPAALTLSFARRGARTVLVDNRHSGPLRLLKALPADDEGGGVDAVIIHPPGGLADGDSLRLDISLGADARVLATTPGSQKWYRGQAKASTRVSVAAGACLEWLPMPSILYDGARFDQTLEIDLAAGANCVGGECVVRGRRAMGERFAHGWLRQTIRIRRAGRLLWHEGTDVAADAAMFESPAGWAGRSVAASVWAVGGAGGDADDALVELWRAALDAASAGPVARLIAGASATAPGLVLAKVLGDDAGVVAALVQQLCALARPGVIGLPARSPRIWST
jgi:urease accessory protein